MAKVLPLHNHRRYVGIIKSTQHTNKIDRDLQGLVLLKYEG
jgi:hypothetical protein